jgi:beta-xylosidase
LENDKLVKFFVALAMLQFFLHYVQGEGPEDLLGKKMHYENSVGVVENLADPFVFRHGDTYYLYGTTDVRSKGIIVYKSNDLVNWGRPAGIREGYALHKEDVWGKKWFWSPEVVFHNKKFYMIYTVEERLAVATSDSPLGPFTQPKQGLYHPEIREIGHKTLFDNGRVYIYFSRLEQGNVIYGAELNADLLSFKEDTLKRLFDTSQEWEHTEDNPDPEWPVAEAPFVMKHGGIYYMFYTANHFRSPDYAVGYATSPGPLGPFTKYEGNPILKSSETIKGPGTTSIVKAPNGDWYMFYHAHFKPGKVSPRKTLMDKMEFIKQADGSPDVVRILGPTNTKQQLDWVK